MIYIIRSVLTLSLLVVASSPSVAQALCDSGGDSTSQLRIVDWTSGEPLSSGFATFGFPAIADSGMEVAILRSLDAAGTSVVLDVSRVDGEKLLKRFELYPDHGGGNPRSESVRKRLVAPNGYLNEGKFTPMDPLFDHTAEGSPKPTADWETEFADK